MIGIFDSTGSLVTLLDESADSKLLQALLNRGYEAKELVKCQACSGIGYRINNE